MQFDQQNAGAQTLKDRVFDQLKHCLRQGCVICIEHTPLMAPRFTPWKLWVQPACYSGDVNGICTEIERCRTAYTDHHIRLNVEDYSCYSRFTFVVHSPAMAA